FVFVRRVSRRNWIFGATVPRARAAASEDAGTDRSVPVRSRVSIVRGACGGSGAEREGGGAGDSGAAVQIGKRPDRGKVGNPTKMRRSNAAPLRECDGKCE